MLKALIVCLLLIVITMLLGIALQAIASTRIYKKQPYLLNKGFLAGRLNMAWRVVLFSLICLLPLYVIVGDVELWVLVTSFVGLPVLVATMPNIEWQHHAQSRLVLTKPLWSTTATIHLKSPYQPFDRQTYQELLRLVSILPRFYGITQLHLASPMFYTHTGELRGFACLERQLAHHGATLNHEPANAMDCLLGKCSLWIASFSASDDAIKRIDNRRWHRLYIELNNKPGVSIKKMGDTL